MVALRIRLGADRGRALSDGRRSAAHGDGVVALGERCRADGRRVDSLADGRGADGRGIGIVAPCAEAPIAVPFWPWARARATDRRAIVGLGLGGAADRRRIDAPCIGGSAKAVASSVPAVAAKPSRRRVISTCNGLGTIRCAPAPELELTDRRRANLIPLAEAPPPMPPYCWQMNWACAGAAAAKLAATITPDSAIGRTWRAPSLLAGGQRGEVRMEQTPAARPLGASGNNAIQMFEQQLRTIQIQL